MRQIKFRAFDLESQSMKEVEMIVTYLKKDDNLTEDDEKKALEKVQKLLDDYIKKIELAVAEKDKEIMTV